MSIPSRWTIALAAVLATSVAGNVAQAADKPYRKHKIFKTPAKKPIYKSEPVDWPPAPIPALLPPSWTGFYAGVSIGGRMADVDWATTAPALGIVPADAGIYAATLSEMHLRLGGYAGYNWQMGPSWVIGGEADFGWADKSRFVGGIPGTYLAGAPAVFTDTAGVDLRWDASLRARLGFLFTPSWMFYGTGGVAWQNMRVGATCAAAGGFCLADHAESIDTTRLGWTLGAGLEAMLPGNWLARVEYRYADFGSVDHTFFTGSGDDVSAAVKVRTHTALFGVAYKFGGDSYPLTPISSRY